MANLLSMTSEASNLLVNIGTGKVITILELAKMILDVSGLDMQLIFKNQLQGDIKKSHADIDLAITSFNWRPKKDLKEWLSEILKK